MTTKFLTKHLKEEIDEHNDRIVGLEKSDLLQNERIRKNCKGVEKLSESLDTVEKSIIKIEISNDQTNKIASWAIGIITSLLVLVLAALITGQATLVFK